MTEQSTPSDLAAWVLDHGVGLTPARQKQLAKGYRRLEAQTDIRGRAVVMYRDRAREAEARVKAVRAIHRDLYESMSGVPYCDECDRAWPCPTIRALDGDA